MAILRTLSEKPWIDKHTGPELYESPLVTDLHAKQIALNMLLAIITVLFTLFIVTFLARSQYPDFKALSADVWQPFYDTSRLWINTSLLVISSIFIQLAIFTLKKEKVKYALLFVLLSLIFTLQFLFAQLWLGVHLYGLGFYVTSNPANSYFYVFTTVHALHLIGGLLVLLHVVVRFWLKNSEQRLLNSLILCSKYMHYLLVIWLALFALMTSSPETYKTLAALCGY